MGPSAEGVDHADVNEANVTTQNRPRGGLPSSESPSWSGWLRSNSSSARPSGVTFELTELRKENEHLRSFIPPGEAHRKPDPGTALEEGQLNRRLTGRYAAAHRIMCRASMAGVLVGTRQ